MACLMAVMKALNQVARRASGTGNGQQKKVKRIQLSVFLQVNEKPSRSQELLCRHFSAFDMHHQMQDFFAHYGQGYRAPLGHGIASIMGAYPQPDNAEHYEDAFDQATERSDMWVNKWDECCCEKMGLQPNAKKKMAHLLAKMFLCPRASQLIKSGFSA